MGWGMFNNTGPHHIRCTAQLEQARHLDSGLGVQSEARVTEVLATSARPGERAARRSLIRAAPRRSPTDRVVDLLPLHPQTGATNLFRVMVEAIFLHRAKLFA